MEIPFSLRPAASAVVALLPGISDCALDNPTPCTELTVRALVNHVMGLSLAFRYAAAPEEAAAAGFVSSGPSFTDDLDPQWRISLPRRLADLVEAWERPASWQGTSTIAGNVMPNHQVAMVALDELVLHGWDLAVATGQPFELPGGQILAFSSSSPTWPLTAAYQACSARACRWPRMRPVSITCWPCPGVIQAGNPRSCEIFR
ncbi:hypothetical protein I540_2403 [Mycobacteroides abscessus subsp. bolletii 1513]|uniref:Mycothiol-dependent maleylpyruvate isomerase metal-binding domain-containing protein n=1 Tax=Mycobacteroides abscessus subsp. bolletii 1513 TaxID=1299321 RepID=X8DQP2_9MYCO|nr:hypothetical protein I540_2403 [Mycobacteroides abscessus subsp. bolletii 1513]